MDALELFQRVLPSSGGGFFAVERMLARDKAGVTRVGTRHHFCQSREELDAKIIEIEQRNLGNPNFLGVYYSLASYEQPFILEVVNGEEKKRWRTIENRQYMQSLWADVDCGEGKPYATKQEGFLALKKFLHVTKAPTSIIVDSGNGLHLYWPLAEELHCSQWQPLANMLAQAARKVGFHIDTNRTTDGSAIPRPPGTHNLKNGQSKLVTVKYANGEPHAFGELHEAFSPFSDIVVPSGRRATGLNQGIIELVSREYVPAAAAEVVSGCAQFEKIRELGGDVNYTHWRAMLGVLKYCTGGVELAHTLSENGKKYSHHDTQTKIDEWNAPPATCEHIAANSDYDLCSKCPLKGKIKTPAQIRFTAPPPTPAETKLLKIGGVEAEMERPELPAGFVWDATLGMLVRWTKEAKTGMQVAVPFSRTLFYIRYAMQDPSGRCKFRFTVERKHGEAKEFTIEGAATDPASVAKELGSYGIFPELGQDMALRAYALESMNNQMQKQAPERQIGTFGWLDDYSGFVLGNLLYRPHLPPTIIVPDKKISEEVCQNFRNETGSAAGWTEAVNFLYNRQGTEPFQYALGAALASIGVPFIDPQYNGIPVSLFSPSSGIGKSTVAQIGALAYSNLEVGFINGSKGATFIATMAKYERAKNLPMILDEMTGVKGDDLGNLLYMASNGRGRDRSSSDGSLIRSGTWRTHSIITSNSSMVDALRNEVKGADGQVARVLEIDLARYEPLMPKFDVETVKEVVDKANVNHSHAGRVLVQYMLDNMETFHKYRLEYQAMFSKALPMQAMRFYRNNAICTMSVLRLAKDCGLHDFDLDNLSKFATRLLTDTAEAEFTTPRDKMDDTVSSMIHALMPNILITHEYRDMRSKEDRPETPLHPVHGEIYGRYVTKQGLLILSVAAMRKWHANQRLSFSATQKWLESQRAIVSHMKAPSLTKGTNYPYVASRTLAIDIKQIGGSITLSEDNE